MAIATLPGKKRTLFKKLAIVALILMIAGFALIFFFISPLSKYLIEKYDVKYTGREITIRHAYVNPFTGYIHLSDFKVKEEKSDSLFFSADGISANFALLKLFYKTYEISDLTLDNFKGKIIQNKSALNFDDLIKLFNPPNNGDTTRTHFNIMHLRINNGELIYSEASIPIYYTLKNIQINSSGLQWYSDTIAGRFSFESGEGNGTANSSFNINMKSLAYRFGIEIKDFDLNLIAQYLKALTNYGQFSASLQANLNVKGNFKEEDDVTFKGNLSINDFKFGKTKNDDYASFEKLTLAINELSPKNHKHLFDSITLIRPFLKYERYDSLNNVETMFGRNGSNLSASAADQAKFNLVIEIANYVKVLSKNFFQSNYQINRLAIVDGDVKFNDYSLSEKFSVDLKPLNVQGDSINKIHRRVNLSFKSGIQPYGSASVRLSINPKDSGDFDMNYSMVKIPEALFNPYTITYTSFPLDRGTLEVEGNWVVREGIIKSNNHLTIIDPRVTKRLKNKDTDWLPLPLIMSFVRERGNVINYEIPITGNLRNPKFHLSDVITDLLSNIFMKPATTPYRMQVKTLEREIEKALTIKWEMHVNILSKTQATFLSKLSDFLDDNPTAVIVIRPQSYLVKEKEYILLFDAKRKYLTSTGAIQSGDLSVADSTMINKMSAKDSLFVNYLGKQSSDKLIFTIQDKCRTLIPQSQIDANYERLLGLRKTYFCDFFSPHALKNQIVFKAGNTTIPYNGFSFYKIEYVNELPESLTKAYEKLNQLNDEAPRKEFEDKRKSQKSITTGL
ncbi:MAG: DUF748 domain-containing protein [Bacteroidetes bacterium]|nr:DUF748 domain-containing protein [Bacteroidota bacterium]